MRYWFLTIAASLFCTAALAQVEPTTGLSVSRVIHEPSASDVGTDIASIQEQNPHYDPLQPNGEPEFVPVYGNGKGLAQLPDESGELYALAGTTTHDLIEITNNSGQAIEFDVLNVSILLRAKGDVAELTEQGSPDAAAQHEVFTYGVSDPSTAPQTVNVPNGSTQFLLLFRTRWGASLDTSPREYVATFVFDNLNGPPNEVAFEVDLVVPEVGDREGSGCVVANDREFPTGLWLVAAGGVAAMASRRRKLEKARASQ